jgi:hypothetical protein
MMDDRADPLVGVLGDLPRLAPAEARAERIHARCAGLYDAAREPERPAPRNGTLVLALLSVVYLFELTRLAARLSFWRL